MSNNIEITEKALKMLKQQSHTHLRIGVRGSGCSGYSYDFKYETVEKETDNVFEFDGIKIIIDPKSMKFLEGATLDYHKSLLNSYFKVINPNVKSSCGCQKSFSIK